MEVARSEALTNAGTAHDTGQATDTHICLLAPEHARREVKIIADLNKVAERGSDWKLLILVKAHHRSF